MVQRQVVILGSTGSIGTQALAVIAGNRPEFQVVGIAASGAQPALLAQQALDFGVSLVGLAEEGAAAAVHQALDAGIRARTESGEQSITPPRIVVGAHAATEVAGIPCDVVLNGMSGAAGLEPTLAALRSGASLALANKESLIIGGPLVQSIAAPGQIIPVDSEHSAIAQCLLSGAPHEVRRLILTASGGPFRGWTPEQLANVTPAEALAHPTWTMGPLVTVNSATLMNKGLELIEAHLLFGVPFDRIDVVIHPQSVVHSMVEFQDGSTIAQASPPNMRIPIALGLSWPHRSPGIAPPCDWTQGVSWDFEPVDERTFPSIALARRAGVAGGTAPAVLNAADEVAVEAFLAERMSFPDIVPTVAAVLAEHLQDPGAPGGWHQVTEIDQVWHADAWSRARAAELIAAR